MSIKLAQECLAGVGCFIACTISGDTITHGYIPLPCGTRPIAAVCINRGGITPLRFRKETDHSFSPELRTISNIIPSAIFIIEGEPGYFSLGKIYMNGCVCFELIWNDGQPEYFYEKLDANAIFSFMREQSFDTGDFPRFNSLYAASVNGCANQDGFAPIKEAIKSWGN